MRRNRPGTIELQSHDLLQEAESGLGVSSTTLDRVQMQDMYSNYASEQLTSWIPNEVNMTSARQSLPVSITSFAELKEYTKESNRSWESAWTNLREIYERLDRTGEEMQTLYTLFLTEKENSVGMYLTNPETGPIVQIDQFLLVSPGRFKLTVKRIDDTRTYDKYLITEAQLASNQVVLHKTLEEAQLYLRKLRMTRLFILLMEHDEKKRKSLPREINKRQIEIRNYEQEVKRMQNDLHAQQRFYEAQKKRPPLTTKQILLQIEEVGKHAKVRKIYLHDFSGDIIIETKPLKVFDNNTSKYTRFVLGRLIIRMSPHLIGRSDKWLLVQNRDYAAEDNYDHPNLGTNGVPCLGEEQNRIHDLFLGGEFYALVDTLIYFFELFPHDGGRPWYDHVAWLAEKRKKNVDDNSLLAIENMVNFRSNDDEEEDE